MFSISIRSSRRGLSIHLIKSLSSGEVSGVLGNLSFAFRIESITYAFVSPEKGILLKMSLNSVIPIAHISDFGVTV